MTLCFRPAADKFRRKASESFVVFIGLLKHTALFLIKFVDTFVQSLNVVTQSRIGCLAMNDFGEHRHFARAFAGTLHGQVHLFIPTQET